MYLTARRDQEQLRLTLEGAWRALHFDAIAQELRGVELTGISQVTIDGEMHIDLTCSWLLRDFLHRAAAAGVATRFEHGPPSTLALVDRCFTNEPGNRPENIDWFDPEVAVGRLGRYTVHGVRSVLGGIGFIGQVSVTLLRSMGSLKHLRPTAIARHVYDTGITAIPIVSLIAFLISVILAYMGAQQLQKFGADIFVVDLVTVGVLRELGVLLTAIIIAGRSGSAFAAEIGAMQLNEEVDALHAMGVDPIEVLVVPRLLGLVIALPLLTMVADLIGLLGGAILCHALLDMPLVQYLGRAQSAIASTTFWVGIIKAPVFACLIAIAGCHCGMRVHGSSRDLGRMTTLAVVQAIFFVIFADAIFAVLFMQLDW